MKFNLAKNTVMNLMKAPSIIVLLLWMVVPLSMTLYFSVIRYNLLNPADTGFEGLGNYEFFMTDEAFMPAVFNSLILVLSIITITIIMGIMLAVLIDRTFPGRGIVRVMLIAPFFIMPTVNVFDKNANIP